MTVSDTHADTIREPAYRVGRKLGRTVYFDGELIGMMDTPAWGAQVVKGLYAVADLERERARADRLADALEPVLIYAECERARADRAEAALDTLLAWTEEHLDGLVDDDADRDPDDEAIFASLRCIVQGNLACTAEEDYTPAQWQALQTIIDRRDPLSAGSGGREATP